MTHPRKARIRWLERQLAGYDERQVAAIGARVRASICPLSPIDPYEVALGVTLDILKRRYLLEPAA